MGNGVSTGMAVPAPRTAAPARAARVGWRKVDRLVRTHPIAVCVGLSLAFAVAHAVWIWVTRSLGAFDADEAGYVANALRFRDALLDGGPAAVFAEMRTSASAPLVSLLSVPFLLVGPRDPRTALMVQPVLMVLCATCIAGIVRRSLPAWPTVLATLAFLTFPSTLHAAQGYWFGLGVAAGMAVAVWALLRSERGTNRWIWVVGPAVGAMALARTMALGFVPAVLVAAVVHVGRDRRALARLAGSVALGLVVAAPWYVAARGPIFDYLLRYGYGDRAEMFGASSPVLQLLHDPFDLVLSAGAVVAVLALGAAAVVVWRAAREHGVADASRRIVASPDRRALLTVAALGMAALMSTANQGGWFVYPLFVAVVPLGAGAIVRSGTALRVTATGVVAVMAVIMTLSAMWLVPHGAIIPMASHYELGFAEHDERFAPERRGERAAVAAEWWAVNGRLVDEIRRLRDEHGAVFTMSGNMLLLNTNTVLLQAQLEGWWPRLEVPETMAPAGERAAHLTPRAWDEHARRVERVLVVLDREGTSFAPDDDAAGFLDQALESGWRVTERIPLPTPGDVLILRHRANGGGA